mmetsp:Transcript_27094/g.45758  ORF Transcript_27094/g.45758 Transcript_27094/m.45758 type:complete len:632 (-) Transcript_27094:127-2022(-)
MLYRVVGLVVKKRRSRGDGCSWISVQIVDACQVDECNDKVLQHSSSLLDDIAPLPVTSMVHIPDYTHCPPFDLDLVTIGSYVEGFGKMTVVAGGDVIADLARSGVGSYPLSMLTEEGAEKGRSQEGPALLLRALTSRRVSPFAAQLKMLLDHAVSLSSSDYSQCAPRLNRLLTPEPPTQCSHSGALLEHDSACEASEGAPLVEYLHDLMQTRKVKLHVHKMLNYAPVKAVKRVKRIRPEEKEFVEYFEARVEEVSAAVRQLSLRPGEGRVCGELRVECRDDESALQQRHITDCQYPPGILYNLPNCDASAPSAKGTLTRGEYLHCKKEPQVQWVLARLQALVSSTGSDAGSLEGLDVLDVGGGRGDLAVEIAKEIKMQSATSKVTIVDMNARSLTAGKEYAASVGVCDYINFIESDLGSFLDSKKQQKSEAQLPSSALREVVVALHACGDLTDMALQHAKESKAYFVVVPCCFNKFLAPQWWGGWSGMWRAYSAASGQSVPTHKTFSKPGLRERTVLSEASDRDACDDEGNDEGDDVWQERRRALGRIAESEPRAFAWRVMRGINILRMSDFVLHSGSCHPMTPLHQFPGDDHDSKPSLDPHRNLHWKVSIESFSIKYSGRNMALCGTPHC